MRETIGGQAVVEGVMYKNKDAISIAVRKKGKIKLHRDRTKSITEKLHISKIPLIRGIFVLAETLVIGMKALSYSTNETAEKNEKLSKTELFFTILFSIAVALLIFKFLPLLLTQLFQNKFHVNNLYFNLIDGALKISIFIIYLWAIGFMNEVKTLFKYHGAEHKVINAYEHNEKIDMKHVRKYTIVHPRCGTSFMLFVFVLSVFFYLFIPVTVSFWYKLMWRVLLLPVIAGVAYEFIKLGGRFYDKTIIVRIIMAPGLLLQKLTTREPSDKQIEVAIASLKNLKYF